MRVRVCRVRGQVAPTPFNPRHTDVRWAEKEPRITPSHAFINLRVLLMGQRVFSLVYVMSVRITENNFFSLLHKLYFFVRKSGMRKYSSSQKVQFTWLYETLCTYRSFKNLLVAPNLSLLTWVTITISVTSQIRLSRNIILTIIHYYQNHFICHLSSTSYCNSQTLIEKR